MGDPTLRMDGYDDCIIGICRRFGQQDLIAYDYEKVIASLSADGLTHDEAVEYFEFNQIGAWMGEGTPCFIVEVDDVDDYIDAQEEMNQ